MLNVAMIARISCISILVLTVSGCRTSPSRRGLDLMNAGDCKAAVDLMLPAAESGDAYSVNNLGVIWKRGCPDAGMKSSYVYAFAAFYRAAQARVPIAFSNLGSIYEEGIYEDNYAIPSNLAAAIDAYTYGARFGDQASIDALTRLGQPVPSDDLLEQSVHARQQEQLNIALMAVGFAAIAEGAHHQTAVPPVPAVSPNAVIVPSNSSSIGPRCQTDVDCGDGAFCIKPVGQGVGGGGVCARPVNRFGTPLITSHTINAHPIASCVFDTQCPFSYTCKRLSPSALSGVCTK